jgi:hypothetical protein
VVLVDRKIRIGTVEQLLGEDDPGVCAYLQALRRRAAQDLGRQQRLLMNQQAP